MKRIVVMGASAGIGLATVKSALRAGHEVRAFARTAENIEVSHANLMKLAGDALDPKAVTDAIQDVDAVIQCLGVPISSRLLTGPITLFSASTEILLQAMHENECRRLLAVTGFGAGDSWARIHPLQKPAFNLLFRVAYRDKSLQEQMIKASELDWTIIRPGVLTNGAARSDCRVLVEPDAWRNGIVSRASVAEWMMQALDDRGFFGTSPVLIH